MKLKNILGVEEDCYIFSINGGVYTMHYPKKSYRCDAEYTHSEIQKAIDNPTIIPIPRLVHYGLPAVTIGKQPYASPVLECLLSTPYFKWYLERKKYNDALSPDFLTRSLVRQMSEMSE